MSSALARVSDCALPPATRTFPLGSGIIVCEKRAVARLPVGEGTGFRIIEVRAGERPRAVGSPDDEPLCRRLRRGQQAHPGRTYLHPRLCRQCHPCLRYHLARRTDVDDCHIHPDLRVPPASRFPESRRAVGALTDGRRNIGSGTCSVAPAVYPHDRAFILAAERGDSDNQQKEPRRRQLRRSQEGQPGTPCHGFLQSVTQRLAGGKPATVGTIYPRHR